MNKRDIQEGLKRQGEILSINEIAKYLKCNRLQEGVMTIREFFEEGGWAEILGGLVACPLGIAVMWIGLYLIGCK